MHWSRLGWLPSCCRSESRKTRIETVERVQLARSAHGIVVEVNPEKQGLKLCLYLNARNQVIQL